MTPAGVEVVFLVNGIPDIMLRDDAILEVPSSHVIIVQPMQHAYAQIKQLQPHLVIVCTRVADEDGCRLLSILGSDPLTNRIPVLIYTAEQMFEDEGS